MKKHISILLWVVLTGVSPIRVNAQTTDREFYQLTIYHFQTEIQEKILDSYLKEALIPALHRLDINTVGVFKALANDTAADKTIYVLIPVRSLDLAKEIPARIQKDPAYQSAGSDYLNAGYKDPPYSRMETVFMHAFPLAPKMQKPFLKNPGRERVYEWRSYESATEALFQNKVRMFNEGGEIGIFKRLQFNAVFYSEVIAGSRMPNLVYMTCFENMDDRNAHWKSFGEDPEWKKLSGMPEYRNNVSHIDIIFLKPADYSDL